MVNIINPEAIAEYLQGFAAGNAVAAAHLCTALGKALEKEESQLHTVTALPGDAPQWLCKKWLEGGTYQRFVPDHN